MADIIPPDTRATGTGSPATDMDNVADVLALLTGDPAGGTVTGQRLLANVKSVTSAYTAAASDFLIEGNAASGSFTITLPTSGVATGQVYVIKKTDSTGNIVTVNPATGTVDGKGSLTLGAQYYYNMLMWDGSTWIVIAANFFPTQTYVNGRLIVAAGNQLNPQGGLALGGIVTKTANYTASTAGDYLIKCDATSAGFTITLPSGASTGQTYVIKKIDSSANIATVSPASGTIDGQASVLLLSQYDYIEVEWDSSNWQIVGGNYTSAGKIGYGLIFGDGSDGSVVFDGVSTVLGLVPSSNTYQLTRDIFCTGITINSGVTVNTGSMRIFCQGTLTNNGTIANNGHNATSSSGAGTTTGSNGSIRAGQGGGGGTASGAANAGGAAVESYGCGTAGAGGNGTSGNTGGAAGSSTRNTDTWMLRSQPGNLNTSNVGGGGSVLTGAAGGGGGGGDGTNSGGGGGGGGGVIIIIAWALVNNGQIQAAGGNGFTPTVGNCGGGGAGAGGAILVYTLTAVTGSGSTNVAAGTPGNGIGTGTAGGTASAGTYLNILVS